MEKEPLTAEKKLDILHYTYEANAKLLSKNQELKKDIIKKEKRFKKLTKTMKLKQSELTTADVFNLVNDLRKELDVSISSVDAKVDGVSTQVANIQGRMTVYSLLISGVISGFGVLINSVLGRRS